MKTTLIALLPFIAVTALGSVTNALVYSDVSSRTYDSDYGSLTVTVTDIVSTPKWDEKSNPPLDISRAIDVATRRLPVLKDGKWRLQDIALNDFDKKGWHYLVTFTTNEMVSKGDGDVVITKTFICAVLLDGRAIVPKEKTK
jgi:hypothetical protein